MKMTVWGRRILLAVLAVVLSWILAVGAAVADNEEIHVVILGTSDMHGNIWGYSYEDDIESVNDGMARIYTYIRKVRVENPIVFLVDAGDEIQGTIMTDDIAKRQPDEEHPVMTVKSRFLRKISGTVTADT